jgi:hypothetical protein
MGSEIIVCGQRFDIEHRVVTFEDEQGFSFYVPHRTDDIGKIFASHPAPGLEQRALRYRARRLIGRSRTLSQLRRVVRQIVVHLDGCRDARMCYEVLQNERGLSVHFMVDNDGTIYQGLDLVDCAFHAGGVNEVSVGIELQNRGDAARNPNYYPEGRNTVTCRIHGAQFLAYDFTEAQYQAMARLTRTLTRVFDDIPLHSPEANSRPVWTTIPNVRSFVGFLGHYHVEREKWDPGPWDFGRLFREVGSKIFFPLTVPPSERVRQTDQEKEKEEQREAQSYFDRSEAEGVGHFPVGPLGYSRLWHGGVHLPASEGTPAFACLRGQIVAARMASDCTVGSCNFLLAKHRLSLGPAAAPFFSLTFHLQQEENFDDAPPWIRRGRGLPWGDQLERGETALLNENVEAGELIGHVGEAGPSGHRSGQIHFAIFAAHELGQVADPGFWELVEGKGRSRLCTDRGVIERFDRPFAGKPRDGLLSRLELRNFFRLDPHREELRRVVAHHLSEWTPGGWEDLERAPDFAALSPGERRRLLIQQVSPTLWWTDKVAFHAGLPQDGMVFSYHPLGFLLWLRKLLRKKAGLRSVGIESADRWEGKLAPSSLTIDSESSSGMIDEEDFLAGDSGRKLTLEDLANGYPED